MLIARDSVLADARLVEPVTNDQIRDALALLGIEVGLGDVKRVTFAPGKVEVRLFARDAAGNLVLVGDTVAEVVITAPVQGPRSPGAIGTLPISPAARSWATQ